MLNQPELRNLTAQAPLKAVPNKRKSIPPKLGNWLRAPGLIERGFPVFESPTWREWLRANPRELDATYALLEQVAVSVDRLPGATLSHFEEATVMSEHKEHLVARFAFARVPTAHGIDRCLYLLQIRHPADGDQAASILDGVKSRYREAQKRHEDVIDALARGAAAGYPFYVLYDQMAWKDTVSPDIGWMGLYHRSAGRPDLALSSEELELLNWRS